MSDVTPAGQEPAAPVPAPGGQTAAQAAESFSREYVEQLRQEAAGYRTKLKKFEDAQAHAEQERLKAAGEFQTLAEQRAAEIEALKAQLARRDRDALALRIGQKHGLPAEIAARLQGADEAALEADAKALAALLPKAQSTPTVPGALTNPARPVPGATPAFDPKRPPRLTDPGLFKR